MSKPVSCCSGLHCYECKTLMTVTSDIQMGMSIKNTALRLVPETLLQSNRNIMSHFSPSLRVCALLKCQQFYGMCLGILIKDSVRSLFGLIETAQSHLNLFGQIPPPSLLVFLWQNIFVPVWPRWSAASERIQCS